MAVAPKAEATPAWAGTTMRGIFSARAIWQACMGPRAAEAREHEVRAGRGRDP